MRKGPGTRWLYRLPSHISKTVPSTAHVCPFKGTVQGGPRRAHEGFGEGLSFGQLSPFKKLSHVLGADQDDVHMQ